MNEPQQGIYPRCFYPEITDKKSGYFDYVVIGINPGTASKLEQAFVKYIKIRDSHFGFEDIKTVAKPIMESAPYYTWVRTFLERYSNKKSLNILWTELVKCQNELDSNKSKKPLDRTTEKRCFEKFLRREIRIFAKCRKQPVLVLLGSRVFWFIRQYVNKSNSGRKEFDQFLYLALYHSSGSRKFHSYFRDGNLEKKLVNARIPKLKKF